MAMVDETQRTDAPLVFLGGTCGDSTWRQAAIDVFETAGIKYFNPQSDDWDDSFVEIEDRAKNYSDYTLFYLGPEEMSPASLVEICAVIHYRRVIVVYSEYNTVPHATTPVRTVSMAETQKYVLNVIKDLPNCFVVGHAPFSIATGENKLTYHERIDTANALYHAMLRVNECVFSQDAKTGMHMDTWRAPAISGIPTPTFDREFIQQIVQCNENAYRAWQYFLPALGTSEWSKTPRPKGMTEMEDQLPIFIELLCNSLLSCVDDDSYIHLCTELMASNLCRGHFSFTPLYHIVTFHEFVGKLQAFHKAIVGFHTRQQLSIGNHAALSNLLSSVGMDIVEFYPKPLYNNDVIGFGDACVLLQRGCVSNPFWLYMVRVWLATSRVATYRGSQNISEFLSTSETSAAAAGTVSAPMTFCQRCNRSL